MKQTISERVIEDILSADKKILSARQYQKKEKDLEKFMTAIENGVILIDFDARTGHNHGTKFRMSRKALPNLYAKVTEI